MCAPHAPYACAHRYTYIYTYNILYKVNVSLVCYAFCYTYTQHLASLVTNGHKPVVTFPLEYSGPTTVSLLDIPCAVTI